MRPGVLRGWRLAVCLLVPGRYLVERGQSRLGWWVFGLYLLAAGVFFCGLGYWGANAAAVVMFALHCRSLFPWSEAWTQAESPRERVAALILVYVALALVVYWPARMVLERWVVVPLILPEGRPLLICPWIRSEEVRRGDRVLYRLETVQRRGLVVEGGRWLGRVLATGGDEVRFEEGAAWVNGEAVRWEPWMPAAGRVIVPEKHWFVLPESGMRGLRFGDWARLNQVRQIALELGVVQAGQLEGRAYRRWFWRQQDLR